MPRKTLLFVLASLTIILIGISVATGTFHTSTEPANKFVVDESCIGCHTRDSVDFAASTVDREVVCRVCHYGSHQTMTVETPYGWFSSAESPYASAELLHSSIHSNPKNTSGGCGRCHVTASCSACHTGVPHKEHGATEYQPTTVRTTTGGFSAFVGNETFYCGTCHDTLPGINRYRADGSQLCLNCHNTDSSGHDPALLAEVHRADVFMVGEGLDIDCSACHDNALTIEHENRGYDCMVCHDKNVREDARFAIDNGLTNCDACHTPIHENYEGAHVSAFMPDPLVTCSACHSNDLIFEHEEYGHDCAACHNSTDSRVIAAISARDGNCSACHDVHEELRSSHTAPYYGYDHINCSTCHDLYVVDEHPSCDTCHMSTREGVPEAISLGLVSCDSCHDDIHPAEKIADAHVSKFEEELFIDCASCHSADMIYEHEVNEVGCGDCHNSIKEEHLNAIRNWDQTCSACHGPIHDNLEGSHTAPYFVESEQLDCFSCHGLYVVDEHPTCNTCHASEREGVPEAINAGLVSCDSCHDPIHPADKLKDAHTSAFAEEPIVNCGSCHDADMIVEHEDRGFDCAACHNNEDQGIKDAIKYKDSNCAACHLDLHPAEVYEPKHFAEGFMANPMIDCIDCHNEQLIVEHNRVGCNACHGDNVREDVKIAIANKEVSCDSCHTIHGDVDEVHISTMAPNLFMNCKQCHLDNLITEHERYQYSDGRQYDCAVCHRSEREGVREAIDNNQRTCTACHEGFHDQASLDVAHTSTFNFDGYVVNCNSCHNNNLIDEHAKFRVFCNTCHDSKDSMVQEAIVGQNGDCAACHAVIHEETELKAKHLTIEDFVTTAPFDVACSSCHSAQLIDEHIELEGGCNACHDSTDMRVVTAIQNSGVNCDACHNIHTDVNEVHVYSYDGYEMDCIDCHSASLVVEHESCNTCHVPDPEREDVQLAIINGDISCGACHEIHGDVNELHMSSLEGYDMDCSDCHVPDLLIEHESCATCHSSTDEAVKLAISNNDVSCSACHEIHGDVNELHMSSLEGYFMDCTSCHVPDLLVEHPDCATCHSSTDPVVKQAIKDKDVSCGSCHEIHSDVDALHMSSLNGYFMDCSSCHEPDLLVEHESCATCHNSADEAVKWAISNNDVNCSACHGIHDDVTEPHLSSLEGYDMNCTGCHVPDLVAEHESCATCHNSADPAVKWAISNNDVSCSACHEIHGDVEELHMSTFEGYDMDCSDCHLPDLLVEHESCATCHNSTDEAVKWAISNNDVSCSACHEIHGDIESAHYTDFSGYDLDCSSCHYDYLPAEHLKYFGYGDATVGYKVFRSTNGTTFTQVGSTLNTAYSSGGLQPNTTYYFRVQAYDKYGRHSEFSNTATVKTPQKPASVRSVRPTSAEFGEKIDADKDRDQNIKYESYNTLTALTDGRDDRFRETRERGNDDRWIFVGLEEDARNYSSVKLQIRGMWRSSTNVGEVFVYPYQNDKTNINQNARVTFTHNKPPRDQWQTYTIDVTSAARAMEGFGWMKFRVKPGFNSHDVNFRISDVWIILENDGTESSYTTPNETLETTTNGNGNPPTAPTNLKGTAFNSVQVDLTWGESIADTREMDDRKTCVLCHGKDVRDEVKLAVKSGNRDCAACHEVHDDVTEAHTGPALPDTPWDCAGCHSNVLTVEHSIDALLPGNHRLDCNSCHSSSVPRVQSAIKNSTPDKSNLRCESCHSGTADGLPAVHDDLVAPHVDSIFPTAKNEDCLSCHHDQVEQFKTGNASHHGIFGFRGNAWVNNRSLTSYGLNIKSRGYMNCTDCHSGDHLAGNRYMLKVWQAPSGYSGYDPVKHNEMEGICLTCHRYEVYKTATTDIARYSHKRHNDRGEPGRDVKYYEFGCLTCHGDPASGGVHGTNLYWGTITTPKGTYQVNSYARYFQNGKLMGGWKELSNSKGICWTNGGCGGKHDSGKEYDRRTTP